MLEEINDNLQQQAKNIYEKSLAENEVNYCDLSELGCIKGGKRLPKGSNLINKPNNHPYIRVRDLNNVIFLTLNNEYEYVDDETQKKISRYITNTGDVIISIVGTIGLTAIVDNTLNNANLTENCVKICNLNKVSPEYLLMYLRSNDGLASLNAGTVGAVQPKLPIKNIQDIKIPIIKDDVMKELNKELHVIFEKISSNMIETKKLSELRDALLPKLMSGEIDVSNIKLDL